MPLYTAVDIETTGTRPDRDEIIEIGIIRCDETGAILSRYETLVRPKNPLPDETAQITGITETMLADAPTIEAVRDRVRDELSEGIIVGHNLVFDIAFLEAVGISFATRQRVDTFHIAQLLSWRESSLALATLCQRFEIATQESHRALADAEASAKLLVHYIHMLGSLRDPAASIIRYFASRAPSDDLIAHLATILPETVSTPMDDDVFRAMLLSCLRSHRLDHAKTDTNTSVESPSLDAILHAIRTIVERDGGTIEDRGEQRRMMRAVEQTCEARSHLMAEAPTGLGKTFAYLVPSLALAVANDERVCVSTHTKLLQDQIFERDIPLLRRAFAECGIPESAFCATKLKGRANYLSIAAFFEAIETEAYDA